MWLLAFVLLVGQPDPALLKKVKEYEKKVAESPDDAMAQLFLGRLLALGLGEWETAIPHLKRGGDEFYRSIAEKEEAKGDPLALGDSWWTASVETNAKMMTGATVTVNASKDAVLQRSRFQERAAYWYALAWQTVPEKRKAEVYDRLKAVAPAPVGDEKSAGNASGVVASWNAFLHRGFSRSGKSAMKILNPNPKKGVSYAAFDTQQVPLIPGKEYTLVFWAFSDQTEEQGKVEFRIRKANGEFCPEIGFPFPIFSDAPFWKRYEYKVTVANKDAATWDLRFGSPSKKGTLWIDDVEILVDGKNVMKNGGFEEAR